MATRKKAAKRAVQRPAGVAAQVSLRTPGAEFRLQRPEDPAAPSLGRAAMEWTYSLRSRMRWSSESDSASDQAERAARLLAQYGIGDDALKAIADAGIVEVGVPWLGAESAGWEARIFPWEYVIAGATRQFRQGRPLSVVRHLRVERAPDRPPTGEPKVLFVEAAPPPLHDLYEFAAERELVQSRLGAAGSRFRVLASPTRGALAEAIAGFKPGVVHLTGFDTHLAWRELRRQGGVDAASLLEGALEPEGAEHALLDGVVLAGTPGRLDAVEAGALGLALASKHHPRLVTFALWNSAARLAPLAVAAGAGAAVGFQDTFDDALAELFVSVFYEGLSRGGWDLAAAFGAAWGELRATRRNLQGTGIALWSATPLIPPAQSPAARTQVRKRDALQVDLARARPAVIDPASVAAGDVGDWISFRVQPVAELNYSLLHNSRPLFTSFRLAARKPGILRGVTLEVTLHVGIESARYERTLDVGIHPVDLEREIHIPLTAALVRSVHETVRTSLTVDLRWGDHVLLRDSFPTRLLPIDQWTDTAADRIWLPSFVFPRDRAVAAVVTAAQRYVQVLRDDPAAGFDGYQSYDPDNPESAAEVDLQVQAIWAAIVHELRLGYINPPPSYSREMSSQRLRTPTMVAGERNGTCIDLSLFFAACLELVDIYPAVILLSGHAFPAYWRSDFDYEAFRKARPEDILDVAPADSRGSAAAPVQTYSWYLGKASYREIVEHVRKGRLVPLETVRLTEHCGFWEAVQAGRDNLRDAREFESLVDIIAARRQQVTPLPVWGEQA